MRERSGGSRRRPRRAWTEERKEAFLETLAETCNVARACESAGMTTTTAYALRLRDPAFAERWQEALAIGYSRVEERLIRDAIGEEPGEPGSAPMSKYDRELALNLLKFHHGEVVGRPRRGGTPPKRASEAETDEAILARLAAVKRRMAG